MTPTEDAGAMSNSLYPWIAEYLVRIAEQHGVKIWDAPVTKKKAQIIEVSN